MLFLNVILGHQTNAIQSCFEIFLTPVRVATIKNEMTVHAGMDKEMVIHCLWECKLMQLLWKSVRRFLRKLEIDLLYDLVTLFLAIFPKNSLFYYKSALLPMFLL